MHKTCIRLCLSTYRVSQKTSSLVYLAIQRPPYYHLVRLPNGPRWMETPLAGQYRVSYSRLRILSLLGWKGKVSVSVLTQVSQVGYDGIAAAYGKYKSVFDGRTNVFAFMLDIAFSKLPL